MYILCWLELRAKGDRISALKKKIVKLKEKKCDHELFSSRGGGNSSTAQVLWTRLPLCEKKWSVSVPIKVPKVVAYPRFSRNPVCVKCTRCLVPKVVPCPVFVPGTRAHAFSSVPCPKWARARTDTGCARPCPLALRARSRARSICFLPIDIKGLFPTGTIIDDLYITVCHVSVNKRWYHIPKDHFTSSESPMLIHRILLPADIITKKVVNGVSNRPPKKFYIIIYFSLRQ